MNKEYFMKKALLLAQKSYNNGDVPIGSIIVKNNKIIGTGYNKKEILKDASMHAELIALKESSKNLNSYHLEDCDLYTTLEPCPMCCGAIINFRIKNIYIGARNERFGSCGSAINLLDGIFYYKPYIEFNILEKECSNILSKFFKELRLTKG